MLFSLFVSVFLTALVGVNAFPLSLNSLQQSIFSLKNPHLLQDASGYEEAVADVPIEGELSKEDYEALPLIDTEQLQELIAEEGLKARAEKLFDIASSSTALFGNPTRVIASPGHWKTISYIKKELAKLKGYYTFKTESFKALYGKVQAFSLLIEGIKPKSLEPLSLSPPTPGHAPVHGNLVLVKNFGCAATDYPDFVSGQIALIKRGECTFSSKSVNAGSAGAVAAIIYDEKALHGTLSGVAGEIPSVSITAADAKAYLDALEQDPKTTLETTVYVDSFVKNVTTLNVVAETKYGDHDNVVSLGAHSDSVAPGPGINDDGSGTISLLEVAKQLTNFKVNNAVRFAWWAAEEEGLLGSTFYANTLSPEENQKLRVFMDYDMMASPNYEYQIYDANNEDHPNGSGDLKDLYVDWYTAHGYNYSFVPFDGRSDYAGFLDNGIPSGGIATGAEGVKTPEGELRFGGNAGEWFDKCYHQLCDDLTNVNYEAWVVNTKLIAHSVATYANSLKEFPKREPQALGVSDVRDSPYKTMDFKYKGANMVI